MHRLSGLAVTTLALLTAAAAPAGSPGPAAVTTATGITVEVSASGRYAVAFTRAGRTFEGDLGTGAGDIRVDAGRDALGGFRRIAFRAAGKAPAAEYAIRAYEDRAVVLFAETIHGAPASSARFPVFSRYPRDLRYLSYRHEPFAPAVFDASGDAPWLLFDGRGAGFLLSPANNFMIANNVKDASGALSVGVEPQVTEVATRLDLQAILAYGPDINAAYETWGRALTDLQGKARPRNDEGPELRTLGYWTDNGSSYWYNFDAALGYAGTLQAIQRELRAHGVPLGYVQVDSWWYPKGGDPGATPPVPPSWDRSRFGNGIYLYQAAPEVFPNGLDGFQRSVGVPLVTHARWIDPTSPYVTRYRMSRQVSTDPRYWDDVMRRLAGSGVAVYEQDWLSEEALPRLDRIDDAGRFLDEMAAAARRYGLGLQYCMALPRHFLQGSRYGNLRTIRVSADGFQRRNWTPFLYGSRLASALGIWPWTDVFFSRDRENVLLATLSAGIVGVGDHLSSEASRGPDSSAASCRRSADCPPLVAANLRHAVRADGVIVKPDTALVPTTGSYLDGAGFESSRAPLVSVAYTRDAGGRPLAAYVFAYASSPSAAQAVEIAPASLGLDGDVYAYRYFDGTGRRIPRGDAIHASVTSEGAYFVLVPLGGDGVAWLGDLGFFASLGRQRIGLDADPAGRRRLVVHFAPGESGAVIEGYAASPDRVPGAASVRGATGPVEYDRATGRFRVRVTPAPGPRSAGGPTRRSARAR